LRFDRFPLTRKAPIIHSTPDGILDAAERKILAAVRVRAGMKKEWEEL